MRAHLAPEKYVVIHDGFDLMAWKDFMQEDEYQNVVLDTHQYLMMAEMDGCRRLWRAMWNMYRRNMQR